MKIIKLSTSQCNGHGLTTMLLVQGRDEMAVLSAVTAVLSHHSITI